MGQWVGARGRDKWVAPAHNSSWGWARAGSCAGQCSKMPKFPKFIQLQYIKWSDYLTLGIESAKCARKSFLVQMELAASYCMLVTLPRSECDKHASLPYSCHSNWKIQQNSYLPVLENLNLCDRWIPSNAKRKMAGGNAPCGNFSGRSFSVIQSSSFSSPWSTGRLIIFLQGILAGVILNCTADYPWCIYFIHRYICHMSLMAQYVLTIKLK